MRFRTAATSLLAAPGWTAGGLAAGLSLGLLTHGVTSARHAGRIAT